MNYVNGFLRRTNTNRKEANEIVENLNLRRLQCPLRSSSVSISISSENENENGCENGNGEIHVKCNNFEVSSKCTLCRYSCGTPSLLKIHFERFHSNWKEADEPPFECTICGKRFATRKNLRTHLFVHSGDRSFGCNECHRRFCTKAQLEWHRTTHREPVFECATQRVYNVSVKKDWAFFVIQDNVVQVLYSQF